MIIWRNNLRAAAVAAFAFFTVACDSGEPSRTADELAADSALAADLALANRDTLLVDSIGAYREPDAAERDTSARAVSVAPTEPAPTAAPVTKPREVADFSGVVASSSSQPNPVVAPPAAPTNPQPAAPEVTKPAPTVVAPAAGSPATSPTTAKPPAPRLTGTRACA